MQTKALLLAAAVLSSIYGSTSKAQDKIKIGNIVVTTGPLKGPGEPTLPAIAGRCWCAAASPAMMNAQPYRERSW